VAPASSAAATPDFMPGGLPVETNAVEVPDATAEAISL
jgi:hypothetical protein